MKYPHSFLSSLVVSTFAVGHGYGAASLLPMTSFGGGDGWLSPIEYPALGTANTTRGLAYNPSTGNLIMPSRTSGTAVKVLDGTTGTEVGSLDVTGMNLGTFTVNMAAVSNDGAIYVGNLAAPTVVGPGLNFRIYRYASEAAAPTIWYDGQPVTGIVAGQSSATSIRTGDSLDIIGSGVNTKIVAGHGINPALPGSNSYSIFQDPEGDGSASVITMSLTGPATGEFRLGITFGPDDLTVIGSQGVSGRYTTYSGSAATLVGNLTLGSAERGLDYATVGGLPLLATLDSNSSLVKIYDMSSPLSPVELASATTVVGPAPNTNGTVAVRWGEITGSTATLYAMSTNSGIQAFTITVPEPTAITLAAIGGLIGWRRRR